jgi:DNA-binding response OmpR family regulator
LTGEEQETLSVLQMALATGSHKERQESLRQIEGKHERVLSHLQTKRILIQTNVGRRPFSPLFVKFIAGVEGISAGKIWRDPKTDRFFRGERELPHLSEQDRRLLRHFLEHSLVAHKIDDLIDAVWAEHDSSGVSNAAVQQAIRHLRQQIEPNPAKPCYLITQYGKGYRFFPEGAPQGR